MLLYVTLLYSTLLYASLRFSTLRYSTLCYSTLRFSTLLYAMLRYSTLLRSALLCSTLLYSTLLYSILLYSTLRYNLELVYISSMLFMFLTSWLDISPELRNKLKVKQDICKHLHRCLHSSTGPSDVKVILFCLQFNKGKLETT